MKKEKKRSQVKLLFFLINNTLASCKTEGKDSFLILLIDVLRSKYANFMPLWDTRYETVKRQNP